VGVGCECCLFCPQFLLKVFGSTACDSLLQPCFSVGAFAPCCNIHPAAEHAVMCKEEVLPASSGSSALLQLSMSPGCEATACRPLPSA